MSTQTDISSSTSAAPSQAELEARWHAIVRAGGGGGWIAAELERKGLAVEREDAEKMSKAQLKRYKKALKAEAAEKRSLKKEAWAAYKATHIVHLGEGVYWNDDADIDRFDLTNPDARRAENELPTIESPSDLAALLALDIPTLRRLTYHREAARRIPYLRFTIPKRDGSPRPIWAPVAELKEAQRWILREIVERLPVHGAAHAFLPGRSIASNAAAHGNASVLLKLDLKDFFPTVTFPRVRGVFRKAGYREQVATLLALLCTEAPREVVEHDGARWFVALGPRCLPQGAPTSPAITNTLCLRLDRRLTGLAAKQGWRYTRYADDLTFSRPADAKGKKDAGLSTVLGAARAIVEDEGFAVHVAKTRVIRPGGRHSVTGLVVNGDKGPRVPREVKRRLRAAIHNLGQGKPLRDGDTIETLVGYAAYVHMTEPALGRELLAALAPYAG